MTRQQDDWVLGRTYSNLIAAQTDQSLLESEGVECFLEGEHRCAMLGFGIGLLQLRLLVRPEHEKQAAQVLADCDLARRRPDDVHFLCDAGGARPELRDLDNLVVDLESLTVCSLGHGAPRAIIEAQVGSVTAYGVAGEELRQAELGTVFYLDGDQRLRGWLVLTAPTPDYPDLSSFPGFWAPGSHLEAPGAAPLEALFGPPDSTDSGSEGPIWVWEREEATIEAELDRSHRLRSLLVTFE